MQCHQTLDTIPIRSLSTQSTTVSFLQVLRDTNSGKDLDAPGLRFCARYTRGADGGNFGQGLKIHVFTKLTVKGIEDTFWGTS